MPLDVCKPLMASSPGQQLPRAFSLSLRTEMHSRCWIQFWTPESVLSFPLDWSCCQAYSDKLKASLRAASALWESRPRKFINLERDALVLECRSQWVASWANNAAVSFLFATKWGRWLQKDADLCCLFCFLEHEQPGCRILWCILQQELNNNAALFKQCLKVHRLLQKNIY